MKDIFEKLHQLKGGNFSEKKSTWFNGSMYYSPQFQYGLVYKRTNWLIELTGEVRINESQWDIKVWTVCISRNEWEKHFTFYVKKSSFLKRLLNNYSEYDIKCSNAKITNWINKSNFIEKSLCSIPDFVIQSIESQSINGKVIIQTSFSPQESDITMIKSVIEFFENIALNFEILFEE
jgi:hypothetical protein